MKTTYPLAIDRIAFDDPCSGCGTRFTPGDLAAFTPDSADFYCFACITSTYEAMKAAQG